MALHYSLQLYNPKMYMRTILESITMLASRIIQLVLINGVLSMNIRTSEKNITFLKGSNQNILIDKHDIVRL